MFALKNTRSEEISCTYTPLLAEARDVCRTQSGKRSWHKERINKMTRDTPNFHSPVRISLNKKNHEEDDSRVVRKEPGARKVNKSGTN